MAQFLLMMMGMLACVVAAVSCATTTNKPTVANDTVSWVKDAWVLPPSPVNENMPAHPTATTTGWYVDAPERDGLGAIMVPYRAVKPHKLLTITYRITATSGAPKFVSVDAPCQGPMFRPMLERQGDVMSPSQEFYRWWGAGILLVADGQIHTVTYALTPDKWTAVFGKGNPAEFAATWNGNLEAVGISFGGCYAAHHVYVTGGKARFEMLGYKIE